MLEEAGYGASAAAPVVRSMLEPVANGGTWPTVEPTIPFTPPAAAATTTSTTTTVPGGASRGRPVQWCAGATGRHDRDDRPRRGHRSIGDGAGGRATERCEHDRDDNRRRGADRRAVTVAIATRQRPSSRRNRKLTSLSHDPSSPWQHLDWVLIGAVAIIAAVGLLMVFSTSRGANPPYYYAKTAKQLLYLVIGAVVGGICVAIDYRHFRDWAPFIYGASVALLFWCSRRSGRATRVHRVGSTSACSSSSRPSSPRSASSSASRAWPRSTGAS